MNNISIFHPKYVINKSVKLLLCFTDIFDDILMGEAVIVIKRDVSKILNITSLFNFKL